MQKDNVSLGAAGITSETAVKDKAIRLQLLTNNAIRASWYSRTAWRMKSSGRVESPRKDNTTKHQKHFEGHRTN